MSTNSKKISLLLAIVIQANAMVGAGIVAIPGFLSQQVGPSGLLSYILCTLFVLCMVLSFGKLSLLLPGDGWSYRYVSTWGGHLLGICTSIVYILGLSIALGFVLRTAGEWLHELIPVLSSDVLGVLAIVTAFVLLGTGFASFWQYIISFMVLLCLVGTTIVCGTHSSKELLSPFMPYGSAPILLVTPKLLFTFLGFESISSLYGKIEDPHRNVPRGGVWSVAVVGLLYIIFSASILTSIPAECFLKGNPSLPAILSDIFPRFAYSNMAIFAGGLFAMLGTLHSVIWSLSQLISDLASRVDNDFFNRQQKKPWFEKACTCVAPSMMILSALTLESEAVLHMSICLVSLVYTLAIATLFFQRDEKLVRIDVIAVLAIMGALAMIGFSIYQLF